jgi:hypothetical protein
MPVISRAQRVEEAHTAFSSEYYYMHEKTHHQTYIIMLWGLSTKFTNRNEYAANVINAKQILIIHVTETTLYKTPTSCDNFWHQYILKKQV